MGYPIFCCQYVAADLRCNIDIKVKITASLNWFSNKLRHYPLVFVCKVEMQIFFRIIVDHPVILGLYPQFNMLYPYFRNERNAVQHILTHSNALQRTRVLNVRWMCVKIIVLYNTSHIGLCLLLPICFHQQDVSAIDMLYRMKRAEAGRRLCLR